jgi:hypothetical protein
MPAESQHQAILFSGSVVLQHARIFARRNFREGIEIAEEIFAYALPFGDTLPEQIMRVGGRANVFTKSNAGIESAAK